MDVEVSASAVRTVVVIDTAIFVSGQPWFVHSAITNKNLTNRLVATVAVVKKGSFFIRCCRSYVVFSISISEESTSFSAFCTCKCICMVVRTYVDRLTLMWAKYFSFPTP